MKSAELVLQGIEGFPEAVRLIKNRFHVAAVYVFGSYARGDSKPDSDLDLCVLIENADERPLDLMREIRLALVGILNMPIDIIVYQKDRFFERRDAGAFFERSIEAEGIAV